jgi:nicotinamidase-related amidase
VKNLFTPENVAMLLIDHQIGTMGWVRSAKLSDIEMNTIVLAKAAKATNIPLVLTASMEDQAQGPLFDKLQKTVPEAYEQRVLRAGQVDCMMDDHFVKAVQATGRKN